MGFIECRDGTKLFYRDWGKGDPVVLVASQALPSDIWNYNVTRFVERGMRCITFDRRGHGRSEAPAGPYDVDTLARDLGSVIERLELRNVTLVGHSLGGGEVVRYLGKHAGTQAHVRAAVLIAPTSPRVVANEAERAHVDALAAAWRLDFPAWIAANERAFFTPASSDALVEWAARLMEAIPLHVLLEVWKTTTSLELAEDLRGIAVPTLVIHGDLDQSVPVASGEATAALVPGARFERISDAAHGVFITHVDAVHRAIAGLLETTARKERS